MTRPSLAATAAPLLLLPLLLAALGPWFWFAPFAAAGAAAAGPATAPARKGAYALRLDAGDRSVDSAIKAVAARLGWPYEAILAGTLEKDYKLEGESFSVFVPDAYVPDGSWGLIAWISPGPKGDVIGPYRQALARRKLLWVGPDNAGNPRPAWCRAGLTLDAVRAMQRRYRLDPERIYVAGLSGGGRMASILGIGFPDVFAGAVPMIGCNYYRELPDPEGSGKFRASFVRPSDRLLAEAKRRSRFALVTGEKDFNRPGTLSAYEHGFRKDGFKHVTYLEVPGMGHDLPPAEWFDRAIAFLDEHRPEPDPKTTRVTPPPAATTTRPAAGDADAAQAALAQARNLAARDVVAGHAALLKMAREHPVDPYATEALKAADALLKDPATRKLIEDAAEADKLLRIARIYIDNRQYASARTRLERIVSDYPNAPAAGEARKLLSQIGG